MRGAKILYPPFFPQMQDDGIISNIELGVENKIDIIIYRYENAKLLDTVFLYFNDVEVGYWINTEENINAYPKSLKIDASTYSDGIYPSYVRVVDIAGNISDSDMAYAVIMRDGVPGLPPPIFTDALSNIITRETILQNGGTHVRIEYEEAAEGDILTTIFLMTNSTGEVIYESYYTHQHTLLIEEVNSGYLDIIPERYLLLSSNANAYCFYSVKKNNNSVYTSLIAKATIFNSHELMLPPPIFNDGLDGVLTDEDIANGVSMTIVYPGMEVGDGIRTTLRGFDVNNNSIPDSNEVKSFTLTTTEISSNALVFSFSNVVPHKIVSGIVDCDYELIRSSEELVSEITTATVELLNTPELPPPIFTDSDNGVLLSSVVVQKNGTTLLVSYESMKVNDRIIILVSGLNAENINVEEAEFTVEYIVSLEAIESGHIDSVIPEDNVLSVGDKGHIQAKYIVYRDDLNETLSSTKNEVIMIDDYISEDSLTVILTLNAPPTDTAIVDQTPFNRGLIFGKSGEIISVTCDPDVSIEETGINSYELYLNENGQGEFTLSAQKAGSYPVTIYNSASPSELINTVSIFKNYQQGNGDFVAYGSTSGAYINNSMPCSIYVVTQPTSLKRADITKVRVTIQNSSTASIVGYPGQTYADIILKEDNSAEIDIINNVVENVSVLLTLPESSGSNIYIDLAFVAKK